MEKQTVTAADQKSISQSKSSCFPLGAWGKLSWSDSVLFTWVNWSEYFLYLPYLWFLVYHSYGKGTDFKSANVLLKVFKFLNFPAMVLLQQWWEVRARQRSGDSISLGDSSKCQHRRFFWEQRRALSCYVLPWI